MKLLLWTLALFVLAVLLSLAGHFNEGYLLLIYPPYRIEISLNLWILGLVAAFGVVYWLTRAVVTTLRLPAEVAAFHQKRREKKAKVQFLEALGAYFEGRFGKAEQLATQVADMPEAPVIANLIAVRAAHRRRNYAKRDRYLARLEGTSLSSVLRWMTEAEIRLDERQPQEALECLEKVRHAAPRLATALQLELKAHQQAQNWTAVLKTVQSLEKRHLLDATRAHQLRVLAHQENLKRKSNDINALRDYWGRLEPALQHDVKLTLCAVQGACQAEDYVLAAQIIENCLAQTWDDNIAAWYGRCVTDNPTRQLQLAEQWLVTHPEAAGLLLSLAQLCMVMELWGKAESYLDASLALAPNPLTHYLLGQLLARSGRAVEASAHYEAAAAQAAEAALA